MTDIYKTFEKRFTESWFSSSWVEEMPVETKAVEIHAPAACRKNLHELQDELQALKSDIENISFKELKLSNLAKFYQ